MQIPLGQYVFRVKWMVVALMAVVIWGCIRLGLWQSHKAEQKQAIISALMQDGAAIPLSAKVLSDPASVTALHLQHVSVKGRYLPQFTFFLDNQVWNGQAGFQVLTPMLLEDTQQVIWVNRGWVAGFNDHQQIPEITTNQTMHVATGLFWQQTRPGFRLDQPSKEWHKVQPVIDFSYLRQHVPYQFADGVLKLDSAAISGFERHWEVPTGQVEKHLSYAYQWFGFALATLCLGVYQMLEKRAETHD